MSKDDFAESLTQPVFSQPAAYPPTVLLDVLSEVNEAAAGCPVRCIPIVLTRARIGVRVVITCRSHVKNASMLSRNRS